MQLVNLFVALGVIVQVRQHHFLVLIRDGHVRDGRGIVDHLFRNFRHTLSLRLRPQHSGEQSSCQAQPRAGLHEISPIHHRHPPPSHSRKRA